MRQRGTRAVISILGSLLCVATLAGVAQAGPPRQAQQEETLWSDCLFEQPPPSNNALVDTYDNVALGITVHLRCGNHDTDDRTGFGVRHIADGHGFDDSTEECIRLTVEMSSLLDDGVASGTGPRNEAFVFPGRDSLYHGVRATVIYNVDTKNVVTAFVQGTEGQDNWAACAEALSLPPSARASGPRQPTAPANPPVAHPLSGSDCSGDTIFGTHYVCDEVEGFGLIVDHVTAIEGRQFSGRFCATPFLYAAGSPYAVGNQVCSSFLTGEASWTFPLNQYFPDGTQVCVKWDDSGDMPCVTVHS